MAQQAVKNEVISRTWESSNTSTRRRMRPGRGGTRVRADRLGTACRFPLAPPHDITVRWSARPSRTSLRGKALMRKHLAQQTARLFHASRVPLRGAIASVASPPRMSDIRTFFFFFFVFVFFFFFFHRPRSPRDELARSKPASRDDHPARTSPRHAGSVPRIVSTTTGTSVNDDGIADPRSSRRSGRGRG